MRQAVIDTNILLSGVRRTLGASNLVVEAWTSGLIRPVVSAALWIEYEDVLKRAQLHPLTHAEVNTLLMVLARNSVSTAIHMHWRPQLRDPGDEFVLEAAINGRADTLVTYNRRDFLPAASFFGIAIMSPAKFLDEVLP